MEPVAVNRITVDQALFAEAHSAIFSARRQKMLLYAGIVFCVFGLILLAVQMRFPVASALSFPALLSGIIVVIWALTLRKSELKKKYRAVERKNGSVSERVVSCYARYLIVETGSAEPVQIDYPDIRDHKTTDHLCILLCRDHTGVLLSKDGFTAGSWELLLETIEQAKKEALEAAKAMEELF